MKFFAVLAASSSLRGIVCMLLAGLFITANDAIIKWLIPHYPVGQILCLQAIVISALLATSLRARGEALFRSAHWKAHVSRGLLYALGSFAFANALRFLPLAEVVAIAFAGPLFMTLFGRVFLHERVGPHRWCAVLAGFIGVLIIIRPGTASMHWAVCLPLVVAVSDSLRDIVTRTVVAGESSQRIMLSTAVILALAAATTVVSGWVPIDSVHWVWFALSAVCFVVAHYFLIEAFRYAQTVVVAPFRYIQIIWGILAGLVFWGEVPDLPVLVGIGVIISSGLYIAYREIGRIKGNI